jgi:hypothetical protein
MATTKPADKSAPKDLLADQKDSEGNLINPPVLPEFEQRLTAAHNSGDDLLIQEVNGEYASAREKAALAAVKREQKRAQSQ